MRWLWLFLPFLLASCLESEARLAWHQDGRVDLTLKLSGQGVAGVADELSRRLASLGFRVDLGPASIEAQRVYKAAGWDRWTGWLPGRVAFRDASGLTFYRVSYVFFEDYGLSGQLVPARVAGIPQVLSGFPFRFVVEAPFSPIESNATERRGRIQVWEGTLGERFALRLRYRVWYPERAAVVLVILLLGFLWRRSRRPRGG